MSSHDELTNPTTTPETAGAADPFDPANLRLPQNFSHAAGVRKLVTTVPVRKPLKQEFVRTHVGDDYQLQTQLLTLKEERETYLVAPPLWPELALELTPTVLYTAVNRQGVHFLWPVRLPGEDGRIDTWNASALEAAELAQTHWVRVQANMSLGAYELYQATGDLPDPTWPELGFGELLKVAFKDRYITELDHPVIRRLRGEL